MIKHKPRYKYDCENCRFNWCCGLKCSCILKLPNPPKNIQIEHANAIVKINPTLTVGEIIKETFK